MTWHHVAVPIAVATTATAVLMFAFDSPDTNYWAALRQNLVAEVIGFLFGAVLAAWVAWKLASERLSRIGKPLIQLIAQLRIDGKISSHAARNGVVLAARALGDDDGTRQQADLVLKDHQEDCDVCGLSSCTARSNKDGQDYCDNCGLPDGYWKGIKVVHTKHGTGGGSAA